MITLHQRMDWFEQRFAEGSRFQRPAPAWSGCEGEFCKLMHQVAVPRPDGGIQIYKYIYYICACVYVRMHV